ncbi:MAG: hypothetical protein CL678_13725 [Bdellovibrionaceae bacterium]|nr:hypothetical protein [Pseudobdellovibrionaceae bacterium]|tara:strand:+ start:2013 stop:3038 length:1026 start_codon:yes stop_codon:yes gene_type:complete
MGVRLKLNHSKILVIRPDRLGDVILSTPVLGTLKSAFPEAQIDFMVQPFVQSLFESHPWISGILTYEPQGRHRGVLGWFRLVREISSRKYDAAIVLHSNKRVTAAVVASMIPLRVGPLSKFHSYLSFNLGKRQKRSLVKMHELEYGLDLLTELSVDPFSNIHSPQIRLSQESNEKAVEWMKTQQLESGFVGIHPGMGGSALNWPEGHYQELVRRLYESQIPVLVTGGPSEKELVQSVSQKLPGVWTYTGQENLAFLGALIRNASVYVAPSTGPLHLAAALGVPVVSFYPDLLVQSEKRWGPWTPSSQKKVFTPLIKGEMGSISVDLAFDAIHSFFKRSEAL